MRTRLHPARPDRALDAVRARSGELGLSRSEYLRRLVEQDWVSDRVEITPEHLGRFTARFGRFAGSAEKEQSWS